MRRAVIFGLPIVLLAGLFFLFATQIGRDTKLVPSVLINKPVPDFTLTGIGDLGAGVCWHDDESRDSIMIASLFEEASAAGLIETPTANGAEIGLRIGVDRGFGVYEGQDTCWVRMYCETWEHLAADVMPASPDNFGIAIARAGCERGPDLARELLLMALEYANVIYRNLAPYLNDEEREAAGLSAVPQ